MNKPPVCHIQQDIHFFYFYCQLNKEGSNSSKLLIGASGDA